MQRLELIRVRRCNDCGRGRAELATDDGTIITVALDASRVDDLARWPDKPAEGPADLTGVVVDLLGKDGWTVRDVVFDTATRGLRALVTRMRSEEVEVIEATAQEGLALALRGQVPMYATDEAIEPSSDRPDPGPHGTLH
jgi:hypothetical protein